MQFKDIIGQQEVKEKLLHACHEGRLAHAMLLHGTEGNGALPLTIAFAQYISCKERSDTDSCGVCPTCRKIATLSHVDMSFSFPYYNKSEGGSEKKTTCDDWIKDWRPLMAANLYSSLEDWKNSITKDNKLMLIPVAEANRIVHGLSLHSYEGGYKFHIIWLAEFLKTETANKLLKVLEEPPAKTIFILIANNTENILPTILSRVQRMLVPRIPDDEIEKALVQSGQRQALAQSIAHFAAGNWNKALQLAHAENPDAFYAEQFQMWMRRCYKKETTWLINWANTMHELTRDEQRHFLNYALEQVRQNLMLNYTGDMLIRMNESEADFSKKFSPFINHLNVEDMMHELSEAHTDISRNAYSKLVLADLSIKMHYLLKRTEPVSA
ncbi:MAG: ATP-binding protein [Flavobacteriales bacterium]